MGKEMAFGIYLADNYEELGTKERFHGCFKGRSQPMATWEVEANRKARLTAILGFVQSADV